MSDEQREKEVRQQIRDRVAELRKNDPYYRDTAGVSQDERMRRARDNMARNIKEHAERTGQDMSFDKAQRKAAEIANSIHREDQQKGKK